VPAETPRDVISLGTKGDRILAGILGVAVLGLGYAIVFPFDHG
jgi:hypothetical protein